MKKLIWLVWLLVGLLLAGSASAYTKEEVEKRGHLRCGVSTSSPGFSSLDADGRWTGLDVDICRAVAAAVLGDANKVEYLPLAENEAFTALLSEQVDLLSRHSTWTFARDSGLAIHFAGISYYDGQGFMVASRLAVKRALDLQKIRVCSPVGSASEENLIDYLASNQIEYQLVPYDSLDSAVKGFEAESCEVLSMQQSQLYGLRLGLANPDRATILPDLISKEPLGPVVRQGDDVWLNIVKWSLYVLINGEELGLGSEQIDRAKSSSRLDVRRLCGLEGPGGKGLGLKNDWAWQVIRQVGNYGEVFERNFGRNSALKVDRGVNNLWNKGGLQYAPPFR